MNSLAQQVIVSQGFPILRILEKLYQFIFCPEYMGKGYGKKLIKAVIEELMKLGYRDILLWVLEDNKRARVFYEKAGFTFGNCFLDDNIGGKKLREALYCYHIV